MRKNVLKLAVLITCLSSTFVMYSQDLEQNSTMFDINVLVTSTDPGTDTGISSIPLESDDTPGAPVDDWLLPFVVISAIVGYCSLRKRISTI
jgi:hypothetical protein